MRGFFHFLKLLLPFVIMALVVGLAGSYLQSRREGRPSPPVVQPSGVPPGGTAPHPAPPAARPSGAYYWDDFEGGCDSSRWEPCRTVPVPQIGNTLYGGFGQQAATFRIDALPVHRFARLSFEFYALRSWDGDHERHGPDIMQVRVIDGPRLLRSSFGFQEMRQSYPHPFTMGQFVGGTGGQAVHFSTPVNGHYSNWTRHYRYSMSFVFPHNADELSVHFAPEGLSDAPDEAWALDNVAVELLQAAPVQPLSDAEMSQALDALAGADAWRAAQAMNRLIAAGDAAVDPIAMLLGWSPDPATRSALQEVVRAFEHDDFSQWRDAVNICREVGGQADAIMAHHIDRRRVQDDLPNWYRQIRTPQSQQPLPPGRYVVERRAAWVLERIWSEQARALLFLADPDTTGTEIDEPAADPGPPQTPPARRGEDETK